MKPDDPTRKRRLQNAEAGLSDLMTGSTQGDGGISCIGAGPYFAEKRGKNEIETVWGVCFTSVCLSAQILNRSDPATKLRVLLEGVAQLSQEKQKASVI